MRRFWGAEVSSQMLVFRQRPRLPRARRLQNNYSPPTYHTMASRAALLDEELDIHLAKAVESGYHNSALFHVRGGNQELNEVRDKILHILERRLPQVIRSL